MDESDEVRTEFCRSDPTNLGPWLSVNQALAWIVTRIASFTEDVGHQEARDLHEHHEAATHGIAEDMASQSPEGQDFLAECQALETWPGGSVFAHAGRALLKHILAGRITPTAKDGGGGHVMQAHEFAGLGRSRAAVEWLSVRPSPQFSANELMAVFPNPDNEPAGSNVRYTAKAERDCHRWLISEFANDPEKNRSKTDFRDAAQSMFSGLSGRGFHRVWAGLAEEHGRNKAGAKPKSSQ